MRRPALAVSAALLLGACSSYQRVPSPLPERLPQNVRVVRQDGSSVRLFAPAVVAGSQVGPTPAGIRIAIPLDDLRELRTRRFDAGRTALVAAAAGAAVLLVRASFHEDPVYAIAARTPAP